MNVPILFVQEPFAMTVARITVAIVAKAGVTVVWLRILYIAIGAKRDAAQSALRRRQMECIRVTNAEKYSMDMITPFVTSAE